MHMISYIDLHERFQYYPKTGEFFYRKRISSNKTIGDIAGYLNKNGYIEISINNRKHPAHRLAWLYMTGKWPEMQIDHINGVRNDNRWENLRLADNSINMRNKCLSKRNKSGVTGVRKYIRNGKEKVDAYIYLDGKQIFLYRGDDFEKAVQIRKMAEFENGFHPNHGRSL